MGLEAWDSANVPKTTTFIEILVKGLLKFEAVTRESVFWLLLLKAFDWKLVMFLAQTSSHKNFSVAQPEIS